MKKSKKKIKKVTKPKAKSKAKAPARPKPKAIAKTKAPKSAGKAVAKTKPTKTPAVAAVKQAKPKKVKLNKEQTEKIRKLLLDLRDHLIDGVNFLANENLKRSNRDASGELSGYSLHMADAGTDNFDREFALSLVSSEQEALYEIAEALKRLEAGEYGRCEMCEKPIVIERLEAVPFTRLCVHCQSQTERDRRGQVVHAGPTFTESADDESDSDDSED
jgi:RNA polymerase-binding protein DksA